MARRDILDGTWKKFQYKKEHDAEMGGRVNQSEWKGPGSYYKLTYQQRCPRNCCYDDVCEMLTADEVKNEVIEKMKDCAILLREARMKNA